MADWIKMRTNLSTDPDVIAIAEATQLDEDTVVGKLHRIWSWADAHTCDGRCSGINARWIDKYVQVQNFAKAMSDRQWLVIGEAEVIFANFDRHNGETAKRRAEKTAQRQVQRVNQRWSDGDKLATNGRQSGDILDTTDKKRRDKNKTLSAADAAGGEIGQGLGDTPRSPHQASVNYFCDSWAATHGGQKYPFTGKDGQHVKTLLKQVDPEKLKRVIDRYLADPDPFVVNDCHGLGLMVSRLRRYLSDQPNGNAAGVKAPAMSKPGEFSKRTYSPG